MKYLGIKWQDNQNIPINLINGFDKLLSNISILNFHSEKKDHIINYRSKVIDILSELNLYLLEAGDDEVEINNIKLKIKYFENILGEMKDSLSMIYHVNRKK